MRSVLLLCVYNTMAFAQYGKYVCMVQDMSTMVRCGACLDRFDCLDPQVLLDCGMSSVIYQEGIDMGTQDNCEAYLQAMSSDTSSDAQLQDPKTGVPALAYALTMVVFNSTEVDNKLNTTDSPDCTLKHIATSGINGSGLQDCINDKLIEYGEEKLEQLACAELIGGVAEVFCTSKIFKAAIGVVNSFANKFIEQSLSHAATSIERAATNVVSKATGWFKSLFHWDKPVPVGGAGAATIVNQHAQWTRPHMRPFLGHPELAGAAGIAYDPTNIRQLCVPIKLSVASCDSLSDRCPVRV